VCVSYWRCARRSNLWEISCCSVVLQCHVATSCCNVEGMCICIFCVCLHTLSMCLGIYAHTYTYVNRTIGCRNCVNTFCVLQCVAVCCSVLQCVAVCCSVLQCVAVCCGVLQCGNESWHTLKWVTSYMNESCHMYEHRFSWKLCHTLNWVMAHAIHACNLCTLITNMKYTVRIDAHLYTTLLDLHTMGSC